MGNNNKRKLCFKDPNAALDYADRYLTTKWVHRGALPCIIIGRMPGGDGKGYFIKIVSEDGIIRFFGFKHPQSRSSFQPGDLVLAGFEESPKGLIPYLLWKLEPTFDLESEEWDRYDSVG